MARTISHVGLKVEGLIPFASALVKGTDENKLVKMSASFTVVATAAENDEFMAYVAFSEKVEFTANVALWN